MNANMENTMRRMHEASVNGAIMDHGLSFPRPAEQIHITDNMPTKSPTFDALVKITDDWEMSAKLLQALEAGEIGGPDYIIEGSAVPIVQLNLLNEIMARMIATKADAKVAHAAWNPAEVVTQLKLEIETGKYGVSQ